MQPLKPQGETPIGQVLQTAAQVQAANARLQSQGVTLHQTQAKNWDMELFLGRVEHLFPKDAAILDVGCAGNPLLLNLAHKGYTRLWGIDFDLTATAGLQHPTITFLRGDLLKTPLPDASLDCITSVSVIEHGVDVHAYLAEMARLLRPGGRLLTSTDFWRRPVTSWRFPASGRFNLPWRCFTPRSLRRLLSAAGDYGLAPAIPFDLQVEEKVVEWHRKRYTFVAFELVRLP